MKNKSNWKIVSIIVLTFILGCVAIITSLKLYQARKQPIAPTAPGRTPAAGPACTFTFTVPAPTLPPGVTPTPIPTLPPGVSPTPTPTIAPPQCPIPENALIKVSPCSKASPTALISPRIYDLSKVTPTHDIRLAYFLGRKATAITAAGDGIFALKGVPSCAPEVGTFVSIPVASTKFEYIEFHEQLAGINSRYISLEPFQTADFGSDSTLYLCVAPRPTSTPTSTPTPTTPPDVSPTPTTPPGATPTPTTPTDVSPTPTTPPGATPTPTTPWWATPTPTTPYYATPTTPSSVTATPTSVYYAGATPTPEVTLPQAGLTLPTIGLTVGGTILFIFSLLLLL